MLRLVSACSFAFALALACAACGGGGETYCDIKPSGAPEVCTGEPSAGSSEDTSACSALNGVVVPSCPTANLIGHCEVLQNGCGPTTMRFTYYYTGPGSLTATAYETACTMPGTDVDVGTWTTGM